MSTSDWERNGGCGMEQLIATMSGRGVIDIAVAFVQLSPVFQQFHLEAYPRWL